jgi:thioredoxin-related protein
MDEGLEVIQAIPGYRDANEFEMIMTYFGENQYQKVPWETYQANYKPLPRN